MLERMSQRRSLKPNGAEVDLGALIGEAATVEVAAGVETGEEVTAGKREEGTDDFVHQVDSLFFVSCPGGKFRCINISFHYHVSNTTAGGKPLDTK